MCSKTSVVARRIETCTPEDVLEIDDDEKDTAVEGTEIGDNKGMLNHNQCLKPVRPLLLL